MAKRKLHMLDYPVELAVRRHALNLLDEAVAAAQRVEAGQDDEALHDLRVAIRRLRTTLRSYGEWLGPTATQARKRLGQLVKKTNQDRDREVHVKWLSAQLGGRTSAMVRTGVRLMLDEMESPPDASPVDGGVLVKPFHKQQRKLRAHLVDTASAPIAVQTPTTYAVATAGLIADHTAALRDSLALVTGIESVDADHNARLAVKRLRYVIEPIAAQTPGGKPLVKKLKAAQDLFGDLHDLQVLEQRVIDAGHRAARDWSDSLFAAARGRGARGDAAQLRACRALAALVQRIVAEQRRIFRTIDRRWLQGGEAFFEKVDMLVARLDPPRKKVADDIPHESPQSRGDEAE